MDKDRSGLTGTLGSLRPLLVGWAAAESIAPGGSTEVSLRVGGWLGISLLAWLAVWAFWLAATHRFHPTFTLALIVTTSLVTAYAAAAYLNHLVLIPRYGRISRSLRYVFSLSLSMVILTATALAIIRAAYLGLWGPDADPNGAAKHFAIDLLGMAVHLAAALAVVSAWRALSRRS